MNYQTLFILDISNKKSDGYYKYLSDADMIYISDNPFKLYSIMQEHSEENLKHSVIRLINGNELPDPKIFEQVEILDLLGVNAEKYGGVLVTYKRRKEKIRKP